MTLRELTQVVTKNRDKFFSMYDELFFNQQNDGNQYCCPSNFDKFNDNILILIPSTNNKDYFGNKYHIIFIYRKDGITTSQRYCANSFDKFIEIIEGDEDIDFEIETSYLKEER